MKFQEFTLPGRRLKSDDTPSGSNPTSGEKGVKPDMGANVKDRHTWLQVTAEKATLSNIVVPY
jgi:hypothetical protein